MHAWQGAGLMVMPLWSTKCAPAQGIVHFKQAPAGLVERVAGGWCVNVRHGACMAPLVQVLEASHKPPSDLHAPLMAQLATTVR